MNPSATNLPLTNPLTINLANPPATTPPIKALLLGRGHFATILARYLSPRFECIASFGSDVPRDSLISVLQSAEACFIITPLSAHFSLAALALEQDCHVFVEKPTTASLHELDTLLALARDKNRVLFTDYTYTFSRSIRHSLQWLRASPSSLSIQARIAQYGKFYAGESVLEVLGVHYLSVFALYECEGILEGLEVEWCQFLDSNKQSARLALRAFFNGAPCPITLECSLLSQARERILLLRTPPATLRVDMLASPALSLDSAESIKSPPLPCYDEGNNLAHALTHFTHALHDKASSHAHLKLTQKIIALLEQAHARSGQ